MTITRVLAYRRCLAAGMTPFQAGSFLDDFQRGAGRDIGWGEEANNLTVALAKRIDAAATGWLLNPENRREEPVEARRPRDGKMLATGEEE